MLSTAYLILLAPLAFAAPADDPPQACAPIGFPNPITADYDDLIVTELPPTEIGTYKWLKYDTFYVSTDESLIAESSPPNHAHSYDYTKPRTIKVATEGNNFDLHSMYVACSGGFPQNDCRIKLRGHRKHGRPAEREVIYPKLENPPPFKMMKVEFGRFWKELTGLEFVSVEVDGTPDYTGLMVDSLTYSMNKCL